MRIVARAVAALALTLSVVCPTIVHAEARSEVVRLWPGAPPGTQDWKGPETTTPERSADLGRNILIVRKVVEPTLTVVRPKPGQATGAAMIVLPGGGFGVLAVDVEGTDVARWLADRGVTAFVLKYRVNDPDPAMAQRMAAAFAKPGPGLFDESMNIVEPRRRIAMEDAMQAVRVIRANAARYGVAPDRIGMMGFSAGAITTASVVLAAEPDSRPDFAASIYGGLIGDRAAVRDSPPIFIAHAEDDPAVPVARSVAIFEAWRKAGAPAELHIYPSGGHGNGLGKPGAALASWPQAFENWLRRQGIVPASPRKRAQSPR